MNTKQLLLEQFDTCYNENGWFVAVRKAVEGLTAAQAGWKPDAAENSIREILAHLSFYCYAYLRRFKGEDYKYPTDNNAETFALGNASEDAWHEEVKRFDTIMTELRSLITAADEGKLASHVSAANRATWAELIANVNTHAAYHSGQIILLRKLQKGWDHKKGVS